MRLTNFFKKTKSYSESLWGRLRLLSWRKFFSFKWFLPGLQNLVDIILKLGTLLLVSFFLIFFLRLFKDHDYVMEPFSVPQQLEVSGFNGQVIALRLKDELFELKEIVSSVKKDSLQLKENQGDIDLAVLGVGLSLKNLAYQIRESLGRENKVIKGEVTRIGNVYEIQIRMTNYPKVVKQIIVTEQTESEAFDQLIRAAAEGLLLNTDPYRLAVLCRYEKRFDDGIDAIRHLLRTNPHDSKWGFLAWGVIHLDQGEIEAAAEKFRKSVEIDPDFSLGWVNLGWALESLEKNKEAIEVLVKVTEIEPENPGRKIKLAWLYQRNEMYAEADSVFQLAYEQTPPGQTKIDVGMSWTESKFNQNDLEGAKKLIDDFNEDLGETPIAYLIKGMSAFLEKDTISALKHLKNGFNLDPGLNYIVNSNVFIANNMGDYQHVIDVFQNVKWDNFKPSQKQNCYNQCAMAYNMLGQYDSALVVIQECIEMDPNTAYPYSTLGEVFFYQNEIDSCLHYIEKSLILGMSAAVIADDSVPPYDQISKLIGFQELLKKYKKESDYLPG